MYRLEQLPPHAIRVLAESLQGIFEQLSADLPSHASKRLAASFESFSRWILRYYESALAGAESDPDPDQTRHRIDAVFSGVLRDVQKDCSRLIHPPGVEDFPQELALWAKDWLRRYGGYDNTATSVALLPYWPYVPRVIFFPNPLRKIESEIERRFFLNRQDGFEKDLANHPEQFLLFTFPRVEGRNILFHPMLLHEFAHAIDRQHKLTEKVWRHVKVQKSTTGDDKARIVGWIREFVADLLATRLGGPCFALALHKLSVIANVLNRNSDTHPASRTRLAVVMEHLRKLHYAGSEPHSAVDRLLRGWQKELEPVLPKGAGWGYDLIRGVLLADQFRPRLHDVVEEYCTTNKYASFACASFSDVVPTLMKKLRAGLPPIPDLEAQSPLPAVLNACWELVLQGDQLFDEFERIKPDQQASALRTLSGLAFKGIEAAQARSFWNQADATEKVELGVVPGGAAARDTRAGAAVLTEQEIRDALSKRADFEITPILDASQIGDGSVNLRLGTHFIVTKAADLASFKPQELGKRNIRRFQEHVSKSFGETFVLHPHRLVLGATFEYIALPKDFAALVLSRSSYGRVGLIVATATYVHPGWKGCLTLELSNMADIPLELPCGVSIAQLVVFRAGLLPEMGKKVFRTDRRPYPTFPEYSSLDTDADLGKLRSFSQRVEKL